MTVNRIKIRRKDVDKKVNIPIATDFDESLGREQLVALYERSEMQDNINIIQDFETTRYKPDKSTSTLIIEYIIRLGL